MRSLLPRLGRATIVLALSVSYLAFVFRLADEQSRSHGLGDWIDPYFINGLLEHWCHVLRTLASPASPPMMHPTPHVLGHSHGLVLFAPFYVALRGWLHPFHAYTAAIFAVMAAGVVCLYALLRQGGRSFVEALAFCALFCSSPNVMNGSTGVWTQRASVFLIPPVLLLAVLSTRWQGWRGALTASAAGLLTSLMYVQDFYTAHFSFLLAAWFAAAVFAVEYRNAAGASLRAFLHPRSRAARYALLITLVVAAAALAILASGGGETRIAGVRLAARDWRRPAVVALLAASFVIWRDPRLTADLRAVFTHSWLRPFLGGAAVGAAFFLWIYLPAFREHSAFPPEEIWRALAERNPYASYRTFAFVGVLVTLALVPWFKVDRTVRLYACWLTAASAFVWLVPLRFGDSALWMAAVRPLPGFAVIRDPARIIYIYELGVVLATALMLRRAPDRRYRAALAATALLLVIARPNHERFDYGRPLELYDRWVAAPLAIEPGCESFFIKGASLDYMARSTHMGALYGIDASFLALRYSVPTLNGFSAWYPAGWELWNPQHPTYSGRVRSWIARHGLTKVCELDIDARTMGAPR